ncbi:MAG: protease pro-enzyme activation domain-containing protein [Limisphaerales bacterium]
MNLPRIGASIAGCVLICFTAHAAEQRLLQGHVPAAIAGLQPLQRLAATNRLQLSIGLPLRHRSDLTNLLAALYDPSSPRFHQYLTVQQFADQFGPSEGDYQKVIDFAQAHGFEIRGRHANRMVLEVAAATADIEAAFKLHLQVYRHPTEKRTFFAPDAEPSMGAGVPVQDIMGLDNYILPHPTDLKFKPLNAKQATGPTPYAEVGSGPGGTFIAKDFRAAYVPGVTNTGVGQMIGLMEFGPYYTNDIITYEKQAGLSSAIVISNIFLDGVTLPPPAGLDAGEQALDIEMSISMAPGATVLFYGGEIVNDILGRLASDNLAKQISCSFGFGINSTSEQLYQEFVAQGQNYFQASGDAGAYVGQIDPPAAEPYVTICGGTALSTTTPGGAWQSENTWVGSGGGISTAYAIPAWQQGINMTPIQGSTTMRNFPDVAMMADTVIFLAANNSTGAIGGTSASTPLWAGFYALVNQQAASLGLPPAGFLNPAIYALGKSANYANCFHDITTGNTTNGSSPTKFFAHTGYDLCTGWGTPKGSNLINALVTGGATNFMLYASPAALNLTAGGGGKVLVTIQPMNGYSGPADLTISGLPSGVTGTFSPSSTANTSLLTLSSSTDAEPGTFTVMIDATNGAFSQTTALALNVLEDTPETARVSLAANFNIAAIVGDGVTFGNGADGSGHAYSFNLLGSALSWNGCLFNEGPANAADMISCSGQTIALSEGQYCSIQLLATAVNGAQQGQLFTVIYTDGTTATFSQNLSDWSGSLSYPGESIVASMAYRDINNGTQDTVTHANLYGYSFGLNNTKTVRSLKLPFNGDVLVAAVTLAKDFPLYATPASFVIAGGGKAVTPVTVQPTDGFTGDVSLSIAGLPRGAAASFSVASPATNTLLTFTAGKTNVPAPFVATVTGALDGIVHTITLPVTVMAAIPGAAAVNLSSAYNVEGIVTDGTLFGSGLDGNSNAYSAALLGSAPSWNGCLFSVGSPNAPDAVACAGQTLSLPQGQATTLLLLATAVNEPQTNQVLSVSFTDGSSSNYIQSFSDWTRIGGYSGESLAFALGWSDTGAGTNNAGMPVNIYGYQLPLNDSRTLQSVTLPNNSNVVILAASVANAPTPVSLPFNRAAVYGDGATFSTAGGLDAGGHAYSANRLGAAPIWSSGVFHLGPSNALDAVKGAGQAIALPTNRYTGLLLLAAGVNGHQLSQTFTVGYADGSSVSVKQSLSDWTGAQNYPGEWIAAALPYEDLAGGAVNAGTTVNLYGYWFPLDNTKLAQSLRLPNNPNVVVLAMNLVNTPLPVLLSSNWNRAGIYSDGEAFSTTGGLDDDGNAYSADALGNQQFWQGALFNFGPPNVTNVVSAAGQTINLPPGQFGSLLLLATAVNGSQTDQEFMVSYTNGNHSTFGFNVSDWANPQHYPNESIVAPMPYRDQANGNPDDGTPVNLYGYTMTLNSSYVVKSITLPKNADIEVISMALSNVTLALPEAPFIVSQPQSLVVTNGNAAAFMVVADGSPTLSYQWQLNGTNISGATSDSLTLAAVTLTNAGSYEVIVQNSFGSVTSTVASLTVVMPSVTFQSAVLNSNFIDFTWSAPAGLVCQVQYSTNLNTTNWLPLGPPQTAGNGVLSASDATSPDTQRFYRVLILP